MTAATPRGTVGWVKLPARPRHMQVIPAGAVLQSTEGPYALVIGSDRRTASKRAISVGRTVTGLAAVVGGLVGQFLLRCPGVAKLD